MKKAGSSHLDSELELTAFTVSAFSISAFVGVHPG
jgi:hypothetical protein